MEKRTEKIKVVRTDKYKRKEYFLGSRLWYKTLFDKEAGGTKNVLLGIAWFEPNGGTCGMHFHDCEEVEYVISGRGEAEVNGKKYILEPGVAVYEPAGVPHNFTNTGDEPMVVVYAHPSSKPRTKNLTFKVTS